MSKQGHTSDARILDRRTLERDHPNLAALLRPGMNVLDVGCGTAAITAGIARAVGPSGRVLGIDRDEALLAIARSRYSDLGNLTVRHQDATDLAIEREFDVVAASRVLQWIDDPRAALARMVKATQPGGRVVVFDYSHARNYWEPEPPQEFQKFYRGWLGWRAANGWDNLMGDHLAELFAACGLADVEFHAADEIARRGGNDFAEAAQIWTYVVESTGTKMIAEGYLTEEERIHTARLFERWCQEKLLRCSHAASVAVGRVSN